MSRCFPKRYKCIKNKLSSLMHKTISTEVQGQTCVWQYTIMPIKLFEFYTFYVFLNFWHKVSIEWSKTNNKQQKLLNSKNNKNMLECKISKQPTMSHYIERINAWTCYNAYAWVPFFTYTARAFKVISFEDWVLEPWFLHLKVNLVKHEVMVSIIFITSLITGSSSHLFDCLGFPLPFPCLFGF